MKFFSAALVTTLLLTGCAAPIEASDEDLDTSEEAVTSGKITAARPGIGPVPPARNS